MLLSTLFRYHGIWHFHFGCEMFPMFQRICHPLSDPTQLKSERKDKTRIFFSVAGNNFKWCRPNSQIFSAAVCPKRVLKRLDLNCWHLSVCQKVIFFHYSLTNATRELHTSTYAWVYSILPLNAVQGDEIKACYCKNVAKWHYENLKQELPV